MLDIAEYENIDKNYHWVLKLIDYPEHPIKNILLDFASYNREFFNSAHLYISDLPEKVQGKRRSICIIHYHSDLNGPQKFMNIQNLDAYKAMGIEYDDFVHICQDVTSETVIDLSRSDALSTWHLNKINDATYFYIADETGFSKEYQEEH